MYEEAYAYDDAGRLETMNDNLTTYSYEAQDSTCPAGALSFAHAVTAVSSSAFCYDKNGNMEQRRVEGAEMTLTHDAENRLVEVEGTAPQTLFKDGFESGDLSAWSSSQTDVNDLKANIHSDQEGDYGMRALIDDNTALYVLDQTPNGETHYYARFRFDPNQLAMATNDIFALLIAQDQTGQGIVQVRVKKPAAGDYSIQVRWYQDDSSWSYSSAYWISDAPHMIELLWIQAPGTGDGQIGLWLDGVNKYSSSSINNDDLEIDKVYFGALGGIDTGTRGTIHLDSYYSSSAAEVDYEYTYDGDGSRILATTGITQTVYLSGYYEYEVYDHTSESFFIAEQGQLTTLTSTEVTVTLDHTFVNPVVFAQPLSTANADQAVVRITDVQPGQFSLKVHEPNDGAHTQQETVSYLVLEAGSWELDDGQGGTLRLEVGLEDTQATVGDSISPYVWETVVFSDAFTNTPIVLTQIQSNYDPAWAKTRQEYVNVNGFNVAMEPEDSEDTPHGGEIIGWLAIEQTTGFTWAGLKMEASTTGDKVTDSWYTHTFSQTYKSAPLLFGWVASRDSSEGAGLRYRNLGTTSVQLKLDDDPGAGTHGAETIHYIALATSGFGGQGAALEAKGTGHRVKKYYNGMAMRDAGKMYYLLTDHLGSTTEIVDLRIDQADVAASLVSRVRYAPFGAQRYSSADLPTEKTYTGQYEDSYIKLNFYGSRWYDPALARFVQPDTIIPGEHNPAAWDRYAYVVNNPMRYTDPTGHWYYDPGCDCLVDTNENYNEYPDNLGYVNTLCDVGCYASVDPWDYVDGAPKVRDALGIGVTWSGNIDVAFATGSFVVGGEIVHDADANTLTSFYVFGLNGSLHWDDKFVKDLFTVFLDGELPVSSSIDAYVTPIYNVDNVAEDYAGPFAGRMSTRSLGLGVRYGDAAHPSEINVAPDDRERAYGSVYGFSSGIAWNEDISRTHYVPASTVNLNTGEVIIHLFDYLFGD